ncbi:MAG: DMT family transporter [Pseudomonadota bacterium]
MSSHLTAILWVLLSTFIWTLIFAAAKFVDGGVGVFQLTLLRYLGGVATLLFIVHRAGGLRAHRSTQPARHFIRTVAGSGGAVAITWASANMPLVDATAIGLSFGVLATLLGAIILKETVSGRHWIAIFVSLIGVAIIMSGKGAFQGGVVVVPAVIALIGAVLFAVEGLLISVLGRSEPALTVMLYVTIFGILLMLGPAILEWRDASVWVIVFCVALGPLGIAGQYCTIAGYRSAPLSVVAPVDYSWLLFSALLGALAFDEVPNVATWVGGLAIIAGGIILVRTDRLR